MTPSASRFPTIVLVCFALVPALVGTARAAEPKAKKVDSEKYALLVGVREYDPNELRKLPYSEPDVVELADVLRKSGYRRENVMLMTQTEGATRARALPTAANIRKELQGLLEDRAADDTVVVAFAGHGVQFVGEDGTFFCPMDAKLKDRSTLVSLDEVYKQLESCKAEVKLLLVDACRNDPRSDNSRARAEVDLESVSRPQGIEPPGGVVALFSCSKGQKAFEHDRLKHGVFFFYVIEALEGQGDRDKDGQIDLLELSQYTLRHVKDFVRAEYGADVKQTPELKGQLRGAPTLLSLRAAPSKVDPSKVDPPKVDPTKPIVAKPDPGKPAGGETVGRTDPDPDRKRPKSARVTRTPTSGEKPAAPPASTASGTVTPGAAPNRPLFNSLPAGEEAAAPAESYWAPDADYFGGIDVRRIIRSPVFRRHAMDAAVEAWEAKLDSDESFAALGFDPLRDLHSVTFFGMGMTENTQTKAAEPGQYALIADGRFPGDKFRANLAQTQASETFTDVAGVRHTLFTATPAAAGQRGAPNNGTAGGGTAAAGAEAAKPTWQVVIGNERVVMADGRATLVAALNRAAVRKPGTPLAAALAEPLSISQAAANARDYVAWLMFRNMPRNGSHGTFLATEGLEKLTGSLAIDDGIRLRVVQVLKDDASVKKSLAVMDASREQLTKLVGGIASKRTQALVIEMLGELKSETSGRSVTTKLDLSEGLVADLVDAARNAFREFQPGQTGAPAN